MKKKNNIHNLDTLEREIYRLRLEAKNKEGQLDSNLEYLQKKFPSILMSSLFCKKEKENHKESFFKSASKNEKITGFLNKVADRFSERAADGIDSLFGKIFSKK